LKNFFVKYYTFLIGLVVFAVYLITASPAVTEFDSGELAAVQATLGIAHPPGYPLFTIIGFLFLKIPLAVTPIFQLHILSIIWSTLSVVFFVLTAKLILEEIGEFKSSSSEKSVEASLELLDKFPEGSKYIAVVAAGLIFSFSKILWTQSREVEVYSLEMLVGILIIYFSFKAFFSEKTSGFTASKYWIVVAFLFGAGFSNHMMTLYLIPATIYLYFLQNKLTLKSISFLTFCTVIVVVIALISYSYIPIRASQNPIMNWGNPTDLKTTYEHVTAKYYGQFFFPGWETIKKQLTFFVASIGFLPGKQNLWNSEFNINVVFVLTGFAISLILRRKLFTYFFLILFTTLFFTVNYNIPDIYTYFSFAYLSLGFFSVISIALVVKFLSSNVVKKLVAIILLASALLFQVVSSYGFVNRSDYYIIEDYTKALLRYIGKDAVIFTNQWDYFLSPGYYIQQVCGYRKDVQIVHKDLIPLSWYMKEEKEKGQILFKTETQSFDISNYTAGREFYISPEILKDEVYTGKFKLGGNQFIIPDLLLFRVVNSEEYYPAADPDFIIRFPVEKTFAVKKIKNIVFIMLQNRIKYELQYGRKDRAEIYFDKLREVFPDEKIPNTILGK
jgi:hypothetical protein